MGDYTYVKSGGDDGATLVASTAVTGGDLLVVSGSGTVATAAATAALNYVGVAAHNAPAGGSVTVWTRGMVHESIADGPVTAGDQLTTTATAGRQVKSLPPSAGDLGAAFNQAADNAVLNTAVNNARALIGIALTTVVDGAKVRWVTTF